MPRTSDHLAVGAVRTCGGRGAKRPAGPCRRGGGAAVGVAAASGTDWALGAAARSRALLAEAMSPTSFTARRSSCSASPGWRRTWLGLGCATASGCAARSGGSRRAASCGARSRHSRPWALKVSPTAPVASSLATGEKVRKRRGDARAELTPQEEQIAQLARDGRTNARDRCGAVHQRTHRGVAPAEGVRQARDRLPQGAGRGAAAAERGRRRREPGPFGINDLTLGRGFLHAGPRCWTGRPQLGAQDQPVDVGQAIAGVRVRPGRAPAGGVGAATGAGARPGGSRVVHQRGARPGRGACMR